MEEDNKPGLNGESFEIILDSDWHTSLNGIEGEVKVELIKYIDGRKQED